jgi:integrase
MTPKNLREHLDYEYAKFKAEVESGAYIAPGKKIFKEFVDMWRENYAKSNLSPTTLSVYEDHIRSRLIPIFGHSYIEQIKPGVILDFLKGLGKPGARRIGGKTTNQINDQRGEPEQKHSEEGGAVEQPASDAQQKPLDFGTIGYIYRVLKNILTRAVEWSMIPSNPMDGISKPTPDNEMKKQKMMAQKKSPQYYNEDEAQALVDALYKESRKWRLLILGSLVGGYRRGELVGLEWTSVHFKESSLSIENNIPLTKKGAAIEKDPKSLSSIRTVDMPEWYMEELQLFHQEWEEEKDDLGDKWEGSDRQFVFHNGVGNPYYFQHPSKWWIRFCKRHGLRYIKFHGLRHSTGTLLIEDEQKASDDVDSILMAIQKRLGHSRLSTTADIYVHLTKKVKLRTTGKFDKFGRKDTVSQVNKADQVEAPRLKLVKLGTLK